MRPQLLDVFEAYRSGRTDFPLTSLAPERLAWALKMGLGPILARTCRDDGTAHRSPQWDTIRAADLAARVTMEEQRDATAELIEACAERVGELTLLKGIWLSEALYPEPHLRPMRDVDVMVEPERVAEVEEVLVGLGYEPQPDGSADQYRHHHHAVPYLHSATGVWVEVHRRLLPARGLYGADAVFEPSEVRAHLQEARFCDLPVKRLSDPMQMLYLAAHWAGSFKAV
ncbi:MAG TPA: nucleotidyltransferase family protein, partial [Vicinamibacteria bacterium]|nr:nucleotidyltransferase family protein [Vicinamibacteria bacterium]